MSAPSEDQEEMLAELWTRPGTLVLPLRGTDALADDAGRLALLTPTEIDEAFDGADRTSHLMIYLGRVTPEEGIPDDGIFVAGGSGQIPVFAVLLPDEIAERLTAGGWRDLRSLALTLDARDTGLLTRAVALVNWHRNNAFSPRTGQPTVAAKGGWVRREAGDGSEHFPRTDPAIIVAVTDAADRLLLASNAAWEDRRFSLIAGFVDAGESLEAAVVREVREESGLLVAHPRYFGSQPWPFPASLMVGFSAKLQGSIHEQRPDGDEIRELRWFTREELESASETEAVLLPSSHSIARTIIESWFGGKLTQER